MDLMKLDRLAFGGEFEERVRRAIAHMNELNVDEMRMEFTHPNKRWHWGADYMSRWIGAMALLGQYTGEDYGVRTVVQELLDFQEPDGSFGPFTNPHDEQEWFGMGRALPGLLEYYSVDPDPTVLDAARRLADFYIEHYPEPEAIEELCECYPSGLEGMVLLAKLTGEQKYLDLSQRVAEESSVNQRCYYSNETNAQGYRKPLVGHTHCQLLTARGMVDLQENYGNSQFMPAVLDLHTFFVDELQWVSGGIPEFLQIPHINETCSDVDWLRLNLQLWKVTGEQRYFDLAENTILNQLYFDQDDQGGFCFWRGLQGYMGSTFDACCSHHGARALADVMRYTYTTEPGVLWANLFLEGHARPTIDGAEVDVQCTIAYEGESMHVVYTFSNVPTEPFTFRTRVPEWAGTGSLRVNAQEVAARDMAGYVEVARSWYEGDRAELHLPMRVRIVRGQNFGSHVIDERDVCVFYGPRLFSFVDTKNMDLVPPFISLDLSQPIEASGPDRLRAWARTVAGARKQVTLTPLANIGGRPNGIGRIHSVRTPYFRVWLPAEPV
ncbi:MAG: glycoside hydrolase family 127 protein [Anaerolineae bacterium]|nr:glycoside hydrolase family 127 protein [Anaerolineae bacterium]